MTRPTVAQLRPVGNPILNGMLLAYMNDDMDYIARRCAPVVTVPEESGTYPILDSKHQLKDSMQRRAYGGKFARGGFTFSSDTYKTKQWGLENPIPDEHRATNQLPLSLEQTALNWLAGQSNIRKEREFASTAFVAGAWSNEDLNSATDWDDASGAPITNCGTARRTIKQASGQVANAIAMGEIVYDALKVNAQILDHLKYTRSMTVTEMEALMGMVLGFPNLFVSKAVYNSANTGQTESRTPIIDDDALVFRVTPGLDLYTVSSLKTLAWAGGGGEGMAHMYRDDSTDSDIAQHKEQWDLKNTGPSTGYFFQDIV